MQTPSLSSSEKYAQLINSNTRSVRETRTISLKETIDPALQMPVQRRDNMKKRPASIRIPNDENDAKEEGERDISLNSSTSLRGQNLSGAKRLNSPTAAAAEVDKNQNRPTKPVILWDLKRPTCHNTTSLLSPLAMREKRLRRSISSSTTDRTKCEVEREGEGEDGYSNHEQKVLDGMIQGLQLSEQDENQQDDTAEEEEGKSDPLDTDGIIKQRTEHLQPARKVLKRLLQKSAFPALTVNAEVRDMKTGKLVKWPKIYGDDENEDDEKD